MFTKIITILFVTLSLQASVKYEDESKYNFIDTDFFVGGDLGFAYNQNEKFDETYYTYGLYAGVPIYGYEVILKKKLQRSKDYDGWLQSLIINIPMGGKFSRQTYFGLIAGKANLKFTDGETTSKSLTDDSHKENFYGAHFGKRYKLTRHLYSRMEIEYLYYGFKIEGANRDFGIDNSLEAVMSVEYRF